MVSKIKVHDDLLAEDDNAELAAIVESASYCAYNAEHFTVLGQNPEQMRLAFTTVAETWSSLLYPDEE